MVNLGLLNHFYAFQPKETPSLLFLPVRTFMYSSLITAPNISVIEANLDRLQRRWKSDFANSIFAANALFWRVKPSFNEFPLLQARTVGQNRLRKWKINRWIHRKSQFKRIWRHFFLKSLPAKTKIQTENRAANRLKSVLMRLNFRSLQLTATQRYEAWLWRDR